MEIVRSGKLWRASLDGKTKFSPSRIAAITLCWLAVFGTAGGLDEYIAWMDREEAA